MNVISPRSLHVAHQFNNSKIATPSYSSVLASIYRYSHNFVCTLVLYCVCASMWLCDYSRRLLRSDDYDDEEGEYLPLKHILVVQLILFLFSLFSSDFSSSQYISLCFLYRNISLRLNSNKGVIFGFWGLYNTTVATRLYLIPPLPCICNPTFTIDRYR